MTLPSKRSEKETLVMQERLQTIYGYSQSIRLDLDKIEEHLKTGNIWDAKDNHKNIKISIDIINSTMFHIAEDNGIRISTFSYKPEVKGITQ